MRVLYLPIIAPGTYVELQRRTKHGLRDALGQWGEVRQIDYLSISKPDVENVLRTELTNYQPDLLFTQLQGVDVITADMLSGIRRDYPDLRIANWNGDVWLEHLTAPDMLELLRHVDIQLTVNGSVLSVYQRAGIRATFLPFGYETPIDPLPDVPRYDVVFLGNNYSAQRQQLYEVLRSLDCSVGIYGAGWADYQGECNYDFATAEALYKQARIAVSDNQFPKALGYLSDRPIQVLAAGGALLLQQRVAGLEGMTGLRAGEHYMPFDRLGDLPAIVEKWLRADKEADRIGMVQRGQGFVLEQHTWRERVRVLVDELLPTVEGEKA